MITLKRFRPLIFLCLTLPLLCCAFTKRDSFPKIEDLVSFSNTNQSLVPTNVIARNFSIDIEKLDIQKFRRNQDSLRKQIMGDDSLDALYNLSILSNYTRRNIPYKQNLDEYKNAVLMQAKTKIADIMLQTIYMARQKIKTLEREEVVKINKETKSYRIAFLYNNLRNYWKKISNIYMTMKDNRDQLQETMHLTTVERIQSPWLSLNPYIILHHKAAKIHVDFLKTWWIFVKIYERQGGRNTTPRD